MRFVDGRLHKLIDEIDSLMPGQGDADFDGRRDRGFDPERCERALGLETICLLDRAEIRALLRLIPERVGPWLASVPRWRDRRIQILMAALGIKSGAAGGADSQIAKGDKTDAV